VTSWRCRAVLGGSALLTGACGGGTPLLHAAHTLPADSITFAAGTSGHFMLGDLAEAEQDLDRAAAQAGGATTDAEKNRFAQGALARFAVAPGVAPFVAGRAGLGNHNEAGLTYTARSLRIDGRHAFEWPHVALSIGAVAIGALPRVGDRPGENVKEPQGAFGLRTAELVSPRGYGLELPVVFGYRSSADVVKLWTGLRAGLERDAFDVTVVQAPDHVVESKANATRLWAGGLVGFSIGLAPIEVRVELDAAYERAAGDLVTGESNLDVSVEGVSLTPAMAISAEF
jgi:hypothetical protein